MTTPRKRWTRGHSGWAFGTALIFTVGIIFGLIWGQLLVGLFLALAVSIGLLAIRSKTVREPNLFCPP